MSEIDRKIEEIESKVEYIESAKQPSDFYCGYLAGLDKALEKLKEVKNDPKNREFIEIMIAGIDGLCSFHEGKIKGMLEAKETLKKYLEELNGE